MMETPTLFPTNLSINDYDYPLPEERIARYPLAERDASKLLVWRNGQIADENYSRLPELLPENALLVFNNSRVVEARLLFHKPSGGRIEIFCLEPEKSEGDIARAMQRTGSVKWRCLIGGASKWPQGLILENRTSAGWIRAEWLEKKEGYFSIRLSWEPSDLPFAAILALAGQLPLPPYLKRAPEAGDADRYQTVYAVEPGSVAAPTAGLHFTDELLQRLTGRGIRKLNLTLHVGAGTFLPVKNENPAEHHMHAEWIDIPAEAIHSLLDATEKKVVAVGTTSLRTMETLYWLGLQVADNPQLTGFPHLTQTAPYQKEENRPASFALRKLLDWVKKQPGERLIADTQLFIVPGYRFRIAQALISNFHQPRSTLLLLVAALTKGAWKEIYRHALDSDYRFLSYGDGCLLLPD